MPARRELLVNLEELILDVTRFLSAGALIHLQRNLCAFGEPSHGIHEADVLVFLDECEHVAAFVTAEAMEDLFVWLDVEAGRLLFVKGAERSEVSTSTLQRQIATNDIHDVVGGANLFESVIGKQTSHAHMQPERGVQGNA